MFSFHIWINLSHQIDETIIVSGLVKRGYKVSAAASTGQLCLSSKNGSSMVMAIKVDKELSVTQELYDDINSLLDDNNILYTSLIISEFSQNCLWNSGNMADDLQPMPAKNLSSKKTVN